MAKRLTDIRWWLLFALVARLWGITDPPLETSHHWRQATVAMVARNFAEGGYDLLHPRMDTAGELTGITGMEFPLLNALIALCISLFGPAHWYGRLIVLLVSSFGILGFHRLIARRCDARTAFHASMLLLVSLWFMYSRKMMPDVFALSLVLMGLERLDAALEGGARWTLIPLACLFIVAGTLSKLTAGCLLAAWPVLMMAKDTDPATRMRTSIALALACLPCCWWYFVWVPHLVGTYGYWHFFMGKPIAQGANELWENVGRVLDNFYFDALRFSGFAVFLFGCFRIVQRKQRGLLIVLLLVSIAFCIIMLRAGDTFWMHAYYVLPFIPVMALAGGYGLRTIVDQRWSFCLLAIVTVEGIVNQLNDFHVNADQAPLLQLENDLNSTGQPDALIAVNSADIPTPMYFAHRRGWTLRDRELARPGALDSLAALGCARVVVMKGTYEGNVVLPWPVLLERASYRIHGRP